MEYKPIQQKNLVDINSKQTFLKLGFYRFGMCPQCEDYLKENGDCMYCDFHSALILIDNIKDYEERKLNR